MRHCTVSRRGYAKIFVVKEIMAISDKKYNLNSGGALKAKLNAVLVKAFAEKQYYQSMFLRISIGLSKIFHAVMLMYIYMVQATFREKMVISSILCATGCLTYLVDYGFSLFWWKGYFATFVRDNAQTRNLIVCAWNPWYSNIYHIRIYVRPSTSFFQMLGTPDIDEELIFSDYFTESGYCLDNKFMKKVDALIDQALYSKTK
jgi:hypothetical protein